MQTLQNCAAVMSLATPFPICADRPARMRRLRSWLLWWLIATLCVYSASASVLRVMGPRHWHAASAEPVQPTFAAAADRYTLLDRIGHHAAQLVAGVQRLADAAHARAHALGAAPHHHSHGALMRHWHGADDETVRLAAGEALDPELADLTASAAIGGATLLPLLAHHLAWQPGAQANGRWPLAIAQGWCSALTAPPLEPPIT